MRFLRGMDLQERKKCGILLTVIGHGKFASGFLLGDAHMGDFYSGLGCGLFVCGAVRLLRVYRLSRDPEKATDYDAMLKDERTMYVANKARSMTFFICVYAQRAAGLLARLVFKQPIIGQVLCLVTWAQSLIFGGTYWYYNKKYGRQRDNAALVPCAAQGSESRGPFSHVREWPP